MEYNFNTERETIKKEGLTIKEFKEILKRNCDEDFNGSNGEDYFITVENDDGEDVQKSRFDALWDDLVCEETDIKKSGASIAETILEEAYSYDSNYYRDSMVVVVDTPDNIEIAVAYLGCY